MDPVITETESLAPPVCKSRPKTWATCAGVDPRRNITGSTSGSPDQVGQFEAEGSENQAIGTDRNRDEIRPVFVSPT
ncbi:hypothetical protein Sinac_0375 [Singulisphaera acidiphila DSM 18658]|uniref:Uncharacterized protein n=1 Tax=Singulisphaera acidiphila (strain ATCC BAA-1392 / DSM 18658 / VKM B-2454 / MOB10) TaxID=886293 RepID=L0D7H7_SINAD|nr:hypothetical protein Sinac_0375 [Singulisphaera acidiphila DSM 18658]